MDFVIKDNDSLQKKKWFALPGNPGIQFYCSQALRRETVEALDKAKVPLFDKDGNVASIKDRRIAESLNNTALYDGVIDILLNHVHDWKGDAFQDEKNKTLKFSEENFKNFILQHGDTDIKLEDNETTTITAWLKDTVDDGNNFIQGDLKNSRATSTQE
jgi:hypothetical protein